MAYEKIDKNTFKSITTETKAIVTEVNYSLKTLLEQKTNLENQLVEVKALIAKAQELGIIA